MARLSGGNKFKSFLKGVSSKINDKKLYVGFFTKATYPNGTTVPEVAAYNEFGTSTQPPRPFFRQMIARHKNDWPAYAANNLRNNNYDLKKTYDQMGLLISGQLKESINTFSGAPLAPSTIARKGGPGKATVRLIGLSHWMPAGSAKQLVDTGKMLDSIDYQVK